MQKFIHDMIHMAEGEKFIEYWWLWIIIIVVFSIVLYIHSKVT